MTMQLQTMEVKWWQYPTWPFGSGELKSEMTNTDARRVFLKTSNHKILSTQSCWETEYITKNHNNWSFHRHWRWLKKKVTQSYSHKCHRCCQIYSMKNQSNILIIHQDLLTNCCSNVPVGIKKIYWYIYIWK